MRDGVNESGPLELYRAKERAVIARLAVDLIKIVHVGRIAKKGTRVFVAGDVETLLLSCVVLLAHVDGKPKSASAIGRALGIPHTTAQRKLNDLEKRGLVERRRNAYFMCDIKRGEDSYIDRAMLVIRRAAQLKIR